MLCTNHFVHNFLGYDFFLSRAVKIITDKKSKQPLGFAYVWFSCEESAQMAVKEMNGKVFALYFIIYR